MFTIQKRGCLSYFSDNLVRTDYERTTIEGYGSYSVD